MLKRQPYSTPLRILPHYVLRIFQIQKNKILWNWQLESRCSHRLLDFDFSIYMDGIWTSNTFSISAFYLRFRFLRIHEKKTSKTKNQKCVGFKFRAVLKAFLNHQTYMKSSMSTILINGQAGSP